MKNYKFLLLLSLAVVFCIGAQSDCDKKKVMQNSNSVAANKNMNNEEMPLETPNEQPNKDIKKLAEGSNSKMDQPFIFVARTKETFEQLKTFVENLPSANEIDFSKQAVIAAFAGEKNTGGFSVKIDGSFGKFSVKVQTPPPDAIVTEALTYPYSVATVPVDEEQNLVADILENWSSSSTTYSVTGGEFEYSGGFVGKQQRFEPKGTIRLLRSGDYVTLLFNLEGKENASERKTNDIASGKITNGKVNLPRLEATNFIEQPHPPFVVSGTISDEKMSLIFDKGKRSFVVNDGFEGTGKLEAVKEN